MKVLVWVLVVHSYHGGVQVYDNIASADSCERLLSRVTGSSVPNSTRPIAGACTQVEKLVFVQPAPTVNVSPAEINVPAPQVHIIREAKPQEQRHRQ